MVLSNKEKAIVLISNAITAYSIYTQKRSLSEKQSLIDFILKGIPDDMKTEISMTLIDEVYDCVSKFRLDS
jgi:hypothetical protein